MESRRKSSRYKRRAESDVDARASKQSNKFSRLMVDTVSMLKLEDGDYQIRIGFPTWKDPEHWGYDVYYNRGMGADGDRYLSRSRHKKDGRDPVLDHVNALKADGNRKLARKRDVSERVFYWVLNRKAENLGWQVLDVPQNVDREISALCKDKSTGETLWLDDPDDGYDLHFRREQKNTPDGSFPIIAGLNIARRSSPLSDDPGRQEELESWLEAHPLPDCLQFATIEELDAVVAATPAVLTKRVQDEDTNPAPQTRSRAQRQEPNYDDQRRDPEPAARPVDDADADLDGPAPTGLQPRARR